MASRSSLPRLLAIALLLAAPRGAAAATLYVNDAGADCPVAADHTSIQAAVDAAKLGGAKRIHVCPGSYSELVRIDGFGRLTLEADPGVTLRPPGPVDSDTLLEVRDSRKVVVRGFTLDGDGQFAGTGIFARGIAYIDSSGTIEGNSVFGIRPEPFAASFSHAIHVTDNDGVVRITIRGNTLGTYGQLGMDVSARSVKILDNVLAGSGSTDVVPQAGIILRGVLRGRVAGNTIGYHWFTPFRAAAGIYLEESSGIRVEANSLLDNYSGIDVVSSTAPSSRNRFRTTTSTARSTGSRSPARWRPPPRATGSRTISSEATPTAGPRESRSTATCSPRGSRATRSTTSPRPSRTSEPRRS